MAEKNQIMNLPCQTRESWEGGWKSGYEHGHKAARHAAAELVSALRPQADLPTSQSVGHPWPDGAQWVRPQAEPTQSQPVTHDWNTHMDAVKEALDRKPGDEPDQDETASHANALQDALVELQSAAWSRSWKRVKAAMAVVKGIVGFDVPGPLTHSQTASHKRKDKP